jgi:hypothetical protein
MMLFRWFRTAVAVAFVAGCLLAPDATRTSVLAVINHKAGQITERLMQSLQPALHPQQDDAAPHHRP